ncbi:hypothetical protein TKK_0002897 [Trichogramma kaykai]
MSQSETASASETAPAALKAVTEHILKYVDMTNDKVLDQMFKFMDRLTSRIECLDASIKELDRRISKQEAADKTQTPFTLPFKEEMKNIKIAATRFYESVVVMPSTSDCHSHLTDQCEMLLSGLPSNLELSDDQVLKKTFSTMGLENHERFVRRTQKWKQRHSCSVKKPTGAIVFQCSSPIVRDGLIAQSFNLSRFDNKTLFNTDGESKLSSSPLWPKNTYNLLREAKSLARRLHYPSPIVRNLTVLMRKSPQSEFIPIHSKIDLDSISSNP